MPFMKRMKDYDWGICTDCRNFSEFGEWSSCMVCGNPRSEVPTCDLFEPVGPCETCANNKGTFNARGNVVVECHRNGDGKDVEFESMREKCHKYKAKEVDE